MNISGAMDLSGASLITNNFTLGNASTLTLTSTAGNIDQNNAITHTGLTVLSATGGDINYNQANNLSNVQIDNANTATINNAANTINLNGVNATNLNVTAAGGITDSDYIIVSGTTTLDSGGANIRFDNLVFNGPDYSSANLGDVNIVSANEVFIYERDNINISGVMGRLDVIAGFDNTSSTIGNVAGNSLQVSGNTGFDLLNTGVIDLTAGGAQSDLQGLVSISNITGSVSDVTLNNISNLQLATLDVTNAGVGTFLVSINDTAAGVSVLANNNNASNTIDLNLTANGAVSLEGELLNMNISTSAGDISSGPTVLNVSGNTVLNVAATSDVDFQANQVSLGTLDITQANNVLIDEVDSISVTDANVNGLLDIIATDVVSVNGNIANLNIVTANTINLSGSVGIVNAQTTAGGILNGAAPLTVIDTAILDAASSDIMLDNAANDIARINIVSAQDVRIIDVNTLQLMDVNSSNLRVETVGNITQTAGSVINVSGASDLSASNGNVVLTEENLFNNLGLIAGGNTNVVNAQALVLNDSLVAGDINISTTAGDISINSINANSVALSAADSLIDANANSVNIVAGTTLLNAVNGIGMTGGANSAIDLQTTTLSALNTASGDINMLVL